MFDSDMPNMNLAPAIKPPCSCINHIIKSLQYMTGHYETTVYKTNSKGCGEEYFCGIKCNSHHLIKQFERVRCSKCKEKFFIAIKIIERCYSNQSTLNVREFAWDIMPIENCLHPSEKLDIDKTTHNKSTINKYNRAKRNEVPPPVYENEDENKKVVNSNDQPPAYEEPVKPKEAWLYAYAKCNLCGDQNIPVKNRCTKNVNKNKYGMVGKYMSDFFYLR